MAGNRRETAGVALPGGLWANAPIAYFGAFAYIGQIL
jgi:hypothetical protein